MDLTYGSFPSKTALRYLSLAQDTANALAGMFLPGALLVQYLPFMRHLPSWMPGGDYKTRIAGWRAVMTASLNEPFENVKSSIVSRTLR